MIPSPSDDAEGLNHGSALLLNWPLRTRKRPIMLRMSFVAHDPKRSLQPPAPSNESSLRRRVTRGVPSWEGPTYLNDHLSGGVGPGLQVKIGLCRVSPEAFAHRDDKA
jgi:hypothetical protein